MKFLHIEDDEIDQEMVRTLIEGTKSWSYLCARSIREGIISWEINQPRVVLIDIGFSGHNDQEAFDAIRLMSDKTCVIALSGRDDVESVNAAHQAGAAYFMSKNNILSPQRFHDAIMESLKGALGAAIKEDHRWRIVEQLAQAVIYGNGKPGLLARAEGIDEKLLAGDKRMATIEGKVDRGRLETLVGFVILLVWLLCSFVLNETAEVRGVKAIPLKNPSDMTEK